MEATGIFHDNSATEAIISNASYSRSLMPRHYISLQLYETIAASAHFRCSQAAHLGLVYLYPSPPPPLLRTPQNAGPPPFSIHAYNARRGDTDYRAGAISRASMRENAESIVVAARRRVIEIRYQFQH